MIALRELTRKLTLRCSNCGHKFRWKRDNRFSFGGSDVFHEPCMLSIIHKRKAEERLDVLASIMELSNLDGRTVQGWLEMRAADETERVTVANKAWRVFHDLDKSRVSQSESDTDTH